MSPVALPLRQRWLLLAVFALGVVVGGVAMVADDFVGPSKSQSDTTPERFTNVTECTTISEPGQYALRRNVGGSVGLSDSCIVINSSDVLLDGFGHDVGGHGVTNSTGITIRNSSAVSNVTVRTVELTNWNRGLLVQNASGVHLRRINASNNADGIAFWNVSRSSIKKSRFERNLVGVVVDEESAAVTVANNDFDGNYAETVAWGRTARNGSNQSAG
jgi:hypothetical protein